MVTGASGQNWDTFGDLGWQHVMFISSETSGYFEVGFFFTN